MRTLQLVLAAGALLASAHAAAQQSPVIHSVRTDSKLESIVVRGEHLRSAHGTRLLLRGYAEPLKIEELQDSYIRARLPARIAAGSYMLTVDAERVQMAKVVLRHEVRPAVQFSSAPR